MSNQPPVIEVNIGGKVPADDVFEIEALQDIDQPDMCSVVLSNIKGERSQQTKEGTAFTVTADGKKLFEGEVTGIEPVFDHNMPTRVAVRGLNKMHKLTRGRKSRTFEKMTDQDIVKKVASESGLSAQCDGDPAIKHDHVYQHNQTDLEFILQRAKRIDFEVRVEGSKLLFQKRKTDGSGTKLVWGDGDGELERFRPRISGANQVKKVVVHGWDPKKKEKIVGEASMSVELGGQQPKAEAETVETERPVYSKEEADALAKSILKDRQMNYVTGEALTLGNPALKAGTTVDIDVHDPKFDGKYYIKSCVHRYIHSVAGVDGVAHREAGYRTLLKLRRDSSG